MTSLEFIQQFISRLKKKFWIILLIALPLGGLFYFIAKQSIILYTSAATIFPLSSSSEGSGTGASAISSLLGISGSAKSFSSDASVNIVELAMSRRTGEAVAKLKVKELGNKNFAQLLIQENNKYTGFLQNKKINFPKDTLSLINIGTNILRENLSAKVNKNGTLELGYTGSDKNLVRLISYAYVDRISEFYIDLKKEKAQLDYNFAVKKVDSLGEVIKNLDARLIKQNESNFFVNSELKRYSIPKMNLEQEKQVVQQQYFYAVNNRESAAYTLQKETPVIKMLDNPEPPYAISKKSAIIYTAIGLIIGIFLGAIIVCWKLIRLFIKKELAKLFDSPSKKAADLVEKNA